MIKRFKPAKRSRNTPPGYGRTRAASWAQYERDQLRLQRAPSPSHSIGCPLLRCGLCDEERRRMLRGVVVFAFAVGFLLGVLARRLLFGGA